MEGMPKDRISKSLYQQRDIRQKLKGTVVTLISRTEQKVQ
jgi:hypothetical protein